MSKTILLHEFRKLCSTVFNDISATALRGENREEVKELLGVRVDGRTDIPNAPEDIGVITNMSEMEKLDMGLMVWIEGSDWRIWLMPFEWRYDILRRESLCNDLVVADGSPYSHLKWDPDVVNPMFGMLGFGPFEGDFVKYLIEGRSVSEACFCAGDVGRFFWLRQLLIAAKMDKEPLSRICALHDYIVKRNQSVSPATQSLSSASI